MGITRSIHSVALCTGCHILNIVSILSLVQYYHIRATGAFQESSAVASVTFVSLVCIGTLRVCCGSSSGSGSGSDTTLLDFLPRFPFLVVVRRAPEGGYSRDEYPAGIYTRADELPVR